MTIWQRTLAIYVDVSEGWLLPDGEITKDNIVAADAWKELRDDVIRALDGIYQNHHVAMKDRPKFDADWEDVPQQAE